MTPFQTDLGDPSSWCDSACDRCPLLPSCRVGQAVSKRMRRLQLEDGPAVLVAEINRDLNRALVILEEACAEEGIDTANLEPAPVPPLVTRTQPLGTDLVRAAVELTGAAARTGRIDEATTTRLVGNASLIAVKTVRVAWTLGDPTYPSALGEPIEPILLLIERANAELRRDARTLAPFAPALPMARFAATHGAMIDLVTPWIAGISLATRAELNARIAAGCAPSPFCRRSAQAEAAA
jgi:hypothetical protein